MFCLLTCLPEVLSREKVLELREYPTKKLFIFLLFFILTSIYSTPLTKISHVISYVKNILNWNFFTYEMRAFTHMKYSIPVWNELFQNFIYFTYEIERSHIENNFTYKVCNSHIWIETIDIWNIIFICKIAYEIYVKVRRQLGELILKSN